MKLLGEYFWSKDQEQVTSINILHVERINTVLKTLNIDRGLIRPAFSNYSYLLNMFKGSVCECCCSGLEHVPSKNS